MSLLAGGVVKGFQAQPFEQPVLVEHRETPLFVVIALERGVAVAKAATGRLRVAGVRVGVLGHSAAISSPWR